MQCPPREGGPVSQGPPLFLQHQAMSVLSSLMCPLELPSLPHLCPSTGFPGTVTSLSPAVRAGRCCGSVTRPALPPPTRLQMTLKPECQESCIWPLPG